MRKLLYKLDKATRSKNSLSAQKTDSSQEKVYCKCLCRILDGFSFDYVPDAVNILQK